MNRPLAYAAAASLSILALMVACSSESSNKNSSGSSGNSSGSDLQPGDKCDSPCQSCVAFGCACKDGTTVTTCSCSSDVCADETFCPSSRACGDHGGPATGSSGGPGSSGTPGSSGGQCLSKGSKCSTISNNNCCEPYSCSGNANLAGDSLCCISQGSACDSDSDCCNNDNTGAAKISCTSGKCSLN